MKTLNNLILDFLNQKIWEHSPAICAINETQVMMDGSCSGEKNPHRQTYLRIMS